MLTTTNHVDTDRHFIHNVLEYVTVVSTATRKKVGAIIVNRNNFVIGQGFNSMPRFSEDKVCEDSDGRTKLEVVHAEVKAVARAARDGCQCDGSTLYCTIPPCPACCQLVIEAGIKRVVYKETYWSEENTRLLTYAGIEVLKFKE